MKKRYLLIILVPVVFFFVAAKKKSDRDRYAELQNFTKVLNLVQQFYVEKVDIRKLIYGGIKGMLGELDPHTNFLPPEIFTEFENETSGEFGGLGIEISLQEDRLTIISPIEDTPAWKVGIKPGDVIVGIDGVGTKGMSLVEAAQLLRGKVGDSVSLEISREGDDLKVYKITRAKVKLKTVKGTDLKDGYHYIKITSFIENTADELRTYLNKQKKSTLKGIILDLRKNPGGLLDQAVEISNLFLDSGIIVSTVGRDQNEKDIIYAKKEGTFDRFPVIVLIDNYSASASEIVAGALRDNKRALIMGEKSFGKGSVQSVIKLGDGSGLKLTVARYFTPNGISIQAEGIKPDIELDQIDPSKLKNAVVISSARREKDIQGHLLSDKEKLDKKNGIKSQSLKEDASMWIKLASKSPEKMTKKEKLLSKDFQVFQAYSYLKAWKVMKGLVK